MGFFNLLIALVLGGVSLYYYMIRKKSQKSIEKFKQVCDKLDYDNQSAELDENGSKVRVSKYAERTEKGEVKYLTYFFKDCKTMYDVMQHGSKESIDGKCIGNINSTRTGVDWISFDVVLRRTKHFGDGLLQLGLEPQATFGIYSMNSAEYTMAEYGCYRHSIVVIPIYETLGSNVCAFISKQAKLTTIFCDTLTRVDSVLKNVKEFGTLKHIIVAEPGQDSAFLALKEKVESLGVTLQSMVDVENLGAAHPQADNPPQVSDLAVICYTSGTTDAPKGVMLTHENIVANFSGIQHHLVDYRLCATDTLISYLPLGHMFERVCEWGVLASGGKVGYFSGDIKNLSDDMKIIKPTMFPCVPRVLNKIYTKIQETVSSSPIKSWLLNMAFESKRKQLQNKVYDNNTIWDHLVFSKIRALLGGHVRIIPVGSAPLNDKVLEFLRCALGCHIAEGYGQTECVAACSVTLIGDFTAGHVGVPLASSAMKLIDVPDMGYFVSQGKGEVLIRGSIVFKGYYMDPKKTAETVDPDGWLHTGDIGQWTQNGTLKIIDRKKDIFKLAQGEYIAPAKIEDIYAQSPYILQIFVYGDSYKSCLVGIVVPNFPLIQESFKKKGIGEDIDFENNEILRGNTQIKQFILEELTNVGKMSKLKSFEQVKDIFIYPEGFTIAQGMVTPTLKNKRFALKQFFQKQIQDMYSKLE